MLCAFFQFVFRSNGKVSCDKVLVAMKHGNKILLQYNEQVVAVVDRAKKLCNAEININLPTSNVGERIFGDLRPETNSPSEEKTFADKKNGRLIALM